MDYKIFDEHYNHWIGYDPITGKLYRAYGQTPTFGNELGMYINNGCFKLRFEGKQIAAHILIWRIMTGNFPDGFRLKHKNGDLLDNRWENLIKLTDAEKARACKLRANNTTGYVGVSRYLSKRMKCERYLFKVTINKKIKVMFGFDTPREAAIARDAYILGKDDQFATLNILSRAPNGEER